MVYTYNYFSSFKQTAVRSPVHTVPQARAGHGTVGREPGRRGKQALQRACVMLLLLPDTRPNHLRRAQAVVRACRRARLLEMAYQRVRDVPRVCWHGTAVPGRPLLSPCLPVLSLSSSLPLPTTFGRAIPEVPPSISRPSARQCRARQQDKLLSGGLSFTCACVD